MKVGLEISKIIFKVGRNFRKVPSSPILGFIIPFGELTQKFKTHIVEEEENALSARPVNNGYLSHKSISSSIDGVASHGNFGEVLR